MKVLICDDLPQDNEVLANAVCQANPTNVEVDRLFGTDLKAELNKLIHSVDSILQTADSHPKLTETAFDNDVDLVILDNNLAQLDIEGARLTAEATAGYIRAFSSASYIVSVNKNPEVDFDLSYLVGDHTTRADLAVNANHLANPALWTHKRAHAKGGFLPWYWPALLHAADDRRTQIKFVVDHLDDAVLDTFGFTKGDFRSLPRQARSLLSQADEIQGPSSSAEDFSRATFREVFLVSSHSLPNMKERQLLSRKLAEGAEYIAEIVSRVVAAEIDLWLRREILGPQDVLIDIPHLLTRMPFVLGNGSTELIGWNAAVDAVSGQRPFGLDKTLFEKHLATAQFEHNPWAVLPYFWWSRLRENEDLNRLFSSTSTNCADGVFCEDCSEFRSMASKEQPTEFAAQFEGSWDRRYVALLDGIRYVPRTRLVQ